MNQLTTIDRPMEIWGQIDNNVFSAAFGVCPDQRRIAIRTHDLSNSVSTFIRCWVFTLIIVKWKAA